MYSCETVAPGKGARITRMVAVRNYSTNTVMEKKNKQGSGVGVKDMEFSGILKKQRVGFPGW